MLYPDYYNTSLIINNQALVSKPKNIQKLSVSSNSAFTVVNKPKRGGFRDLVRQSLKRIRTSDEVNCCCNENTNSSASSVERECPIEQDELKDTKPVIEEEKITASEKKRDAKMRTKFGEEFNSYSNLDMSMRKEFYDQCLKDMNQKQNVRGRKRTNVVRKAKNLKELMTNLVIPEWEEYLIEKRDKENASKKKLVRSDAVWKKIMRDCREFYRILFKNRFHRMDYQDHEDKIKCIQTLTLELGFPDFREDNLIYSYNFFHQIHLSEKNKAKYQNILSDHSTGFDALNWYTNKTRTLFLEDPLCSRLLYFLYRNFLSAYSELLSKNIKSKVIECINYVLERYEELRSDSDTILTSELPI